MNGIKVIIKTHIILFDPVNSFLTMSIRFISHIIKNDKGIIIKRKLQKLKVAKMLEICLFVV